MKKHLLTKPAQKGVYAMSRYLSYLPDRLIKNLISHKVIPIIGAGFSKNALLPPEITMPDWEQLGRYAASRLKGFSYKNALQALSAYEAENGRLELVQLLSELLCSARIKPGSAHTALCSVFHDIIFTTNFDFLLENALQASGWLSVPIYSHQELAVDLEGYVKLIKLHGDFKRPEELIITENDYDTFTDKKRLLTEYISGMFLTHTPLLIGYSFDDYDIRSIWQTMNARLSELQKRAYCIMVNADMEEIINFKHRNVTVISLPGNKSDYNEILTEFFQNIHALISAQTPESNVSQLLTVSPASTDNPDISKTAADSFSQQNTFHMNDLNKNNFSGSKGSGSTVKMEHFSLLQQRTQTRIRIRKKEFIIGSSDNCDFTVEGNVLVSSKHASISIDFENIRAFLCDLNSTNGTYVNDIEITGRTELEDGCTITLANENLIFHMPRKKAADKYI